MFISPEGLANRVVEKSDIYSFGIVMLVLRLPPGSLFRFLYDTMVKLPNYSSIQTKSSSESGLGMIIPILASLNFGLEIGYESWHKQSSNLNFIRSDKWRKSCIHFKHRRRMLNSNPHARPKLNEINNFLRKDGQFDHMNFQKKSNSEFSFYKNWISNCETKRLRCRKGFIENVSFCK